MPYRVVLPAPLLAARQFASPLVAAQTPLGRLVPSAVWRELVVRSVASATAASSLLGAHEPTNAQNRRS